MTASSAAEQRKTAPIATAPNPSAESRRGASTESVPKSNAGRRTNQPAPRIERSRSARTSADGSCGSSETAEGVSAAQATSRERRDRERPERPADPGHRRDAADDRPEERAADGRGERASDQRAAIRGRRRRDEPAERAGPRERARHSLQEAGEVELPRFLAETEEHGADRNRRHPDQHRELQAEASGEDAARDRAEERSGGVRSREDARARLAERELVGEVGQKRRQRREEERVEEDDGARQQKQVAHPASLRTELERALPTHGYAARSAMRVGFAVILAALAVPAVAPAGTVFLLDGRGWGHGVGMSQWGAEGYARHGFGYRQILAHYYPQTTIEAGNPRPVRVLLSQGRDAVRIGSAAPFVVLDARGRKLHLPARSVVINRKFTLRHKKLRPPLRFQPGAQPLQVDFAGYRGDVVVKRKPAGLMVVEPAAPRPLPARRRPVGGAEGLARGDV